MKKLALTIALVLGLSMTTFADGDNHHGGLFGRGLEPRENPSSTNRDGTPMLPPGHGLTGNQDGNQTTPLGTGIVVLAGLGAAYLVGKKRKED